MIFVGLKIDILWRFSNWTSCLI